MRMPTHRRPLPIWAALFFFAVTLCPLVDAAVALKLTKNPANESLLIRLLKSNGRWSASSPSSTLETRGEAASASAGEPKGIQLHAPAAKASATPVDSRPTWWRRQVAGNSTGAAGDVNATVSTPDTQIEFGPSASAASQSGPDASSNSAGVENRPNKAWGGSGAHGKAETDSVSAASNSAIAGAPSSTGNPSATGTPSAAGAPSASSAGGSTPAASATSLIIPGTWVQGQEWTVQVSVGDTAATAQTVSVIIDSGSADFWSPAYSCGQDCADMTPTLHVAASCEQQQRGYGSGAVTGCFANASLGIGSYSLVNYEALAAVQVSMSNASTTKYMDGIWGVGQKSIALDQHDTVIDVLYARGMIEQPLVGFYLTRDEDQADSEVVIGNPAKLANYGSIVNTAKTVVLPNAAAAASNASASYDGFYVTELGGMAVGNKSIPISSELGYALFDTGTTNIFAPDETLKRVYAAFFDNHNFYLWDESYVVPCNYTQNENDVVATLTFGGVDFGLQWRDIKGAQVDPSSTYCFGNLYPSQPEFSHLTIIGGRFLVNVFHVVNSQTGEVTLYGLND